MNIAILGFARDGKAAYEHWNVDGNQITICDSDEKTQVPQGAKASLGPDYLKNLDQYDLLVRTAGLPPKLITQANPESPHILDKVTGNISEFLRLCPTKNTIGVTGTKGKGTTSTLIAKMLEAAGHRVHLGGNIGIASLELLKDDIQPEDWVVLEMGAFQLVDQKYSTHIGVCLMVEPEHLDWFDDMNQYITAKQQLFRWQTADDIAIFLPGNINSTRVASISQGHKIPYFQPPGAHVAANDIVIDDQTICRTDELQLLGKHNWQNVCAALTAAWQVTQDVAAMRSVLTSFTGLPHRLEFVREVNGVKYYDDSFASAPPAPAAAMEAVEGKKVMIVGGFDRGLELSELASSIKDHSESIRKVLLIGQTGPIVAQALDKIGIASYKLSSAKTMAEIVSEASKLAKVGDSVVLSPGFASFDMFKDFEDRGQQFKAEILKLLTYNSFIFKDYSYDSSTKILKLDYSFDDKINFTETFTFDFEPIADFEAAQLDQAFQSLFFLAGSSYYKAYPSRKIEIRKGRLDQQSAEFFAKTYQKGLAEFFYVNGLDPNTSITFPANVKSINKITTERRGGLLIGIGGGKDSLVSVEILRQQEKVATWSLSHRHLLEPLIKEIGLPHLWVDRQWDRSLLEHNKRGALNGHVPFSAILACVGTVVSVLSGYSDMVVSNESSASEPNLTYKGVDINHQYSKSLEFEKDYQEYLQHTLGDASTYYSFLRPLSEVHIAKLFARLGLDKYFEVFSSCNNSFKNGVKELFWCGHCPKCAFVFLALTPFVERAKLEKLFSGKNLLLDTKLEKTYRQLLGIEGIKPLQCVGEVKESRAAMRLAQKQYPELVKYNFYLPKDYNYLALGPHSMPENIHELLLAHIEK